MHPREKYFHTFPCVNLREDLHMGKYENIFTKLRKLMITAPFAKNVCAR